MVKPGGTQSSWQALKGQSHISQIPFFNIIFPAESTHFKQYMLVLRTAPSHQCILPSKELLKHVHNMQDGVPEKQ
jgi:hypothetical protein